MDNQALASESLTKLHAEIGRHLSKLEGETVPVMRERLLSIIEGQSELGYRLGILTRAEADSIVVSSREIDVSIRR
ncbi:hypothetical protein [Stutzerimonas nitrititolerans]|uniref:hypothetical protein n=1 Tax=Stutzerimonas nitrititolerans TaxID=2482751 RepID=UPI0028A93A48|nr:hypothetical protein [Stutzerimonas nitrititolerans]